VALGIEIRPVQEGLLVLRVIPNSPAERASLMTGDLLAGVTTDDLSEAIDAAAGSVLKLQFRRGDRRIKREVSVAVPEPRREAA
jgi:S1-C subfamily serine protease